MRRLRLHDLLESPGEIARIREVLARGGVAAIPTETFYALAADPTSDRGVSRIFEIKGRDDGKPLLVLCSDRDQLERLGIDVNGSRIDRFLALWPAPLTAVFPLQQRIAASRSGETLAVRIPDSARLRQILSIVGPLTGTSANRSGEAPIADPDELARTLGPELDLLVDGGATPGGPPSTLVDATVEPPRVLRAGAFAWPDETDRISGQGTRTPS